MPFLLSTDNILEYLSSQTLGDFQDLKPTQIHPKLCKNFNLMVEFPNHQSLLLKQEPHDAQGHTKGDLFNEWRLHEWMDICPQFTPLHRLISHALAFDHTHSILILRYLIDYSDLETVYGDRPDYPPPIAHVLGVTLAEIHRSTFDRADASPFLKGDRTIGNTGVPDFTQTLRHVTPETFGRITSDGLKFYELMQRYESLSRAIAQLNDQYAPCCLIHTDLKFSNVLLHHDWQTRFAADPGESFDPKTVGQDAPIRIIDWEKWLWGDPAFDLGSLVADYLKRWLKSLMVSPDLSIELALRLATTPLEQVQPSIVQLIDAYLRHFPEVLERFPDFLSRVMRFAGLKLIQSIEAHIHYYEPFGNGGICMLQVAKTLLCSPEASMQTVLGQTVLG